MWFFKVFGKTIFRQDLWSFQDRAVAGGVALGLFVACTPTFGIQMLIVAALAYILRINLPLGLAATWLTNWFTAPVIYYFCYQVGAMLLGGGPAPVTPEHHASKLDTFMQIAKPLWIGSLFVGTAIAAIGYLLTLFVWRLRGHIRLHKILKQKDTDVDHDDGIRSPDLSRLDQAGQQRSEQLSGTKRH
jgi:uncharacterized protein (DUF2062 family)